jgi:hypothetical protein
LEWYGWCLGLEYEACTGSGRLSGNDRQSDTQCCSESEELHDGGRLDVGFV